MSVVPTLKLATIYATTWTPGPASETRSRARSRGAELRPRIAAVPAVHGRADRVQTCNVKRFGVRTWQSGSREKVSIVVCGDRDRHIPLRNHLATQRAIPRCGLQVYFDIGHVPFIEAPDSCAADIERFLATIG